MAPLIGITGRRRPGRALGGLPASFDAVDVDLFIPDYARGVQEAGGLPVFLLMDADPAAYVERLDGVLLSGGADVDPGRYGAEVETAGFVPETARDDFELALGRAAAERGLPVLGICRGLQLSNVLAGGTLVQDVPPHARWDEPGHHEVHAVQFEEGSRLRSLYGERRSVNSLHHQAVDLVAPGFRVTARADDGTVEGIESDDGRVLCVQWHPELLAGRPTDPLFAWLVDAARSRSRVRA